MIIHQVLKRFYSSFNKLTKKSCNLKNNSSEPVKDEGSSWNTEVINNGSKVFLYKRRTGHLYYDTDLDDYLSTDDCSICNGERCSCCRIEYNILTCGSHYSLYQGFDKNKAIEVWKENDVFTGRTNVLFFNTDFSPMPYDFDTLKNALVIVN